MISIKQVSPEREKRIKKPKVSVIIPLYNKADYVKRAIDSVLLQTESDFEVIVVGGKSTDGSENIILSYTDTRIQLIPEEGTGVSDARNQGVHCANADYIAFLDADDEWSPRFLETMLNMLSKYPDMGLYGCLYNYNSKNKPLIDKCNLKSPEDTKIIVWNANSKKTYFYYCACSGEYPIQTSGVLIPRNVFLEYGGFNTHMMFYEDVDLWDKIAYKYDICTTKEALSTYHIECSSALERIGACNNKYLQPFIDFWDNEIDKTSRNDLKDIQLYIESLNIEKSTVSEHYSKTESLNNLFQVHSKELLIRKYMMIIAILLPVRCRKMLTVILNKVRDIRLSAVR